MGFPCDQFGGQEPGSDEQIDEFCRVNYGVTFPLSTKVEVNGPRTHQVFRFLKKRARGALGSRIKWNFTKFLVSPDGATVKRYPPTTAPEQIADDIRALLPTASRRASSSPVDAAFAPAHDGHTPQGVPTRRLA